MFGIGFVMSHTDEKHISFDISFVTQQVRYFPVISPQQHQGFSIWASKKKGAVCVFDSFSLWPHVTVKRLRIEDSGFGE